MDRPEATSAPRRSIVAAASACSELFEQCSSGPAVSQSLRDDAGELWSAFNLWAAYVGAFAAPKASLDARLADHENIADMILKMLAMIERSLRYEVHRKIKATEVNDTKEFQEESGTDLLIGLDAVKAGITRLNSLSVAIRRSSAGIAQTRLRLEASPTAVEDLCFLPILQLRFKNANVNFLKQVARSIHVRGRSLSYQQRHNRKLAEMRQAPKQLATANVPKTAKLSGETFQVNEPTLLDEHHGGGFVAVMSETNPSLINKEKFREHIQRPKAPRSHVSTGSSVKASDVERFDYPGKPRVSGNSSSTACPLCCRALDISTLSNKDWERHVDEDIEPYICLSESCADSMQFFSSSRDWKSHMQQKHDLEWAWKVHTTTWQCDLHQDERTDPSSYEFCSREDLLQHLLKTHGDSFSKTQALLRARRGRTHWVRDSFTCPLCDCVPDEIQSRVSEKPYEALSNHIGRHIKTLAFMSLAYLDPIEGDSLSTESLDESRRESAKEHLADLGVDDDDDDDDASELMSIRSFSEPEELSSPVSWPTRLQKSFPSEDKVLTAFAASRKEMEGRKPEEESIDVVCEYPMTTHSDEATYAGTSDFEHSQNALRLRQWLSPPDFSSSEKNVRDLRCEGTGEWLLQDSIFQSWSTGQRQHLWLHGGPGYGKTVLLTRILDHLLQTGQNTLRVYFDRYSKETQPLRFALVSLVCQVQALRKDDSELLENLLADHDGGRRQPSTETLSGYLNNQLRIMGKSADSTYILVDGLDELKDLEELMDWLAAMSSDNDLKTVKLLATSRPLLDIRRALGNWDRLDMGNRNHGDIYVFLKSKLQELSDPETANRFQDAFFSIGHKSEACFLWAAVSAEVVLQSIKRGDLSKSFIDLLPPGLEDLYSWLIRSHLFSVEQKASRLLQFALHSPRPLTLSEMYDIEAVRVIPDNRVGFDPTDRLAHASELLGICPGLLRISSSSAAIEGVEDTIDLVHSSARDYLLDVENSAHTAPITITTICLAYLAGIAEDEDGAHIIRLKADTSSNENEKKVLFSKFPLARFAATLWVDFARSAEASSPAVDTIIAFLENRAAFRLWAILRGHQDREHEVSEAGIEGDETPLHFACLKNLPQTAKTLISRGADLDATSDRYGTALRAASLEGHQDIVILLLQHGADPNGVQGHHDTALQAACLSGHREIVMLLLEHGADVNAEGGIYGSALQTACHNGHLEIGMLLLKRGANCNSKGGGYHTALNAACSGDRLEIVQLLLDSGANINESDPHSLSALLVASGSANLDIVRLLLSHGASVNAVHHEQDSAFVKSEPTHLRRPTGHSPLSAALLGGHEEVARTLLNRGADVGPESMFELTPLYLASFQGFLSLTKAIFGHPEWTSSDEDIQKSLGAALSQGHSEVAEFLEESLSQRGISRKKDADESL